MCTRQVHVRTATVKTDETFPFHLICKQNSLSVSFPIFIFIFYFIIGMAWHSFGRSAFFRVFFFGREIARFHPSTATHWVWTFASGPQSTDRITPVTHTHIPALEKQEIPLACFNVVRQRRFRRTWRPILCQPRRRCLGTRINVEFLRVVNKNICFICWRI